MNARLTGTTLFEFVVKTTGRPDRYFRDVTSRFAVDPLVYGGLSVKVSARDVAAGLTPLPILCHYQRISTIDVDAWSAWAAGVVARYGPGGDFWVGRTDGHLAPVHFEVLNEPYVPWFYPSPEPAAYATYFKTVVTRARWAGAGPRMCTTTSPPSRYG